MKKEYKITAVITAVFLLLGIIVYLNVGTTQYAGISVLLKFENINKGMYPNESKFDKNQIISEEILQKAAENLEIDMSPQDLRKNIEVVGLVPKEIKEQLSSTSGELEGYFPNTYQINLYNGNELKLEKEKQQQLLNEIVKEYQNYFYSFMSLKKSLPESYEAQYEDVISYDYIYIPDILNEKIDLLKNHILNLQKEYKTFRSASGYSFSDVYNSLEKLQDIKVQNINALIKSNSLTRDPKAAVKRYENMIANLELEIYEKEEKAKKAEELLVQIESDNGENNNSDSSLVEALITQDNYKKLLENAREEGVEAKHKLVETQYYLNEIKMLKEKGELSINNKELVSEVENMTKNLLISLDEYKVIISKMNDELFNSSKNITIIKESQMFVKRQSKVFILASFLFLGIIISLLIVLALKIFVKYKAGSNNE